MKGKGVWMPKRRDGKNWRVDYAMTLGGIEHAQHRLFRVRVEAADFIRRTKVTVSQDARITKASYRIRRTK